MKENGSYEPKWKKKREGKEIVAIQKKEWMNEWMKESGLNYKKKEWKQKKYRRKENSKHFFFKLKERTKQWKKTVSIIFKKWEKKKQRRMKEVDINNEKRMKENGCNYKQIKKKKTK